MPHFLPGSRDFHAGCIQIAISSLSVHFEGTDRQMSCTLSISEEMMNALKVLISLIQMSFFSAPTPLLFLQLTLMRSVRQSIIDGRFPDFIRTFMKRQFPSADQYPSWAVDALASVNVALE